MIEVYVKTILSYVPLLGGVKEQQIKLREGSSIKELLYILIMMYGNDLKEALFDKSQSEMTCRGTALLLNGRNIYAHNGLDTILKSEDILLILPPIAGG